MDITWLTDRIAVGGGIWTSDNMAKLAEAGITHIIDMQIEFDDTPLGVAHGIEVLWNPTDDDFESKPAALFERGVNFAQAALAGTVPYNFDLLPVPATSAAYHPGAAVRRLHRRLVLPRPRDGAGCCHCCCRACRCSRPDACCAVRQG